MTTAFDPALYEPIRAGAQASAAVVVPLILNQYVPPNRTDETVKVIDVGCGEGWWARGFADQGCDILGVDGPAWNLGDHPLFPYYEPRDLRQRLRYDELGRHDIAVCLEVAEHLPEWRAESFVSDLVGLADVVVFSAAIPHQTGAGHINCQWQSWWAALFAEHGMTYDLTLRYAMWTDDRIEPWYRQNLVVYGYGFEEDAPLDVVHPIIHGWGR